MTTSTKRQPAGRLAHLAAHEQSAALQITLESADPTLLIVRRARKRWRCTCALTTTNGYMVRVEEPDGEEWEQTSNTDEEAERETIRLLKEAPGRKVRVEILANRNYRPDCLQEIHPGDIYVEYVGEAFGYEHGTSYCARCAVAVWPEVSYTMRGDER